MSNQYFNFYYDPTRQGYDTSIWRTIFGDAPQAGGGSLMVFPNSSFIHLADILRGDAVFNINVGAPSVTDNRIFGFSQLNKNAYAYFQIFNDVFSAETSNGSSTTSLAITWQSEWSNTDTDFRIKWEAGTASFYVNGGQQAVIQDVSISGDSLSLYVSNTSPDTLLLNSINVKAIQSLLMHENLEDSTYERVVYMSDALTISESITMLIPILFANNGIVSENLTISESVTVSIV